MLNNFKWQSVTYLNSQCLNPLLRLYQQIWNIRAFKNQLQDKPFKNACFKHSSVN